MIQTNNLKQKEKDKKVKHRFKMVFLPFPIFLGGETLMYDYRQF